MNIRKIEIFKLPIKLKEPFIISLGELVCAENIIVRITTSEGLTGFGECSPFPLINGETIDTGFIVGKKISMGLIGKNPLDTEGCSDLMDKVIFANSSIKSAISTALYDIAAQNSGLPLYAFLGGKKDKQLVTDYTVSLGDPLKMAEDASKIIENGFTIVKVKVGRSGRTDIERIRQIRKSIGIDIPVRIDANQGWNKTEAIDTLKSLGDYNIQFCEEPLPRWEYMDLPEIRKNSPIPVMADESCSDHNDAGRLIGISACDYINIKLGKSAGFLNSIRIVHLAEKAGIKMQIGGFLESRLGFTASAHLALASDFIRFIDFDSPLMMSEDPVSGGITYRHGGVIILPESNGLGAEVDEKYLKTLTGIIIK